MTMEQNWHTEEYRGMDIHVTALPHRDGEAKWDYTVRIAYPGEDAGAAAELAARSGDDGDYSSAEKAIEAGFIKGHAMVDRLSE